MVDTCELSPCLFFRHEALHVFAEVPCHVYGPCAADAEGNFLSVAEHEVQAAHQAFCCGVGVVQII